MRCHVFFLESAEGKTSQFRCFFPEFPVDVPFPQLPVCFLLPFAHR